MKTRKQIDQKIVLLIGTAISAVLDRDGCYAVPGIRSTEQEGDYRYRVGSDEVPLIVVSDPKVESDLQLLVSIPRKECWYEEQPATVMRLLRLRDQLEKITGLKIKIWNCDLESASNALLKSYGPKTPEVICPEDPTLAMSIDRYGDKHWVKADEPVPDGSYWMSKPEVTASTGM